METRLLVVAYQVCFFFERKATLTLRSFAASQLPSKLSGTIVDQDGTGIAHAVVGFEDTFRFVEPDDYNRMGKAFAVLTDENGRFELPSNERTFPICLSAFLPGIGKRDLRLHSMARSEPITSWSVRPGVTITGRVVDPEGPVANYNVCVSRATEYYGQDSVLVVATDSEGRFKIDGIPEGPDAFGRNQVFCFFGDYSQQDSRGHLLTKRFDTGNAGQVLDFGDLILAPVVSLKLTLDLQGGKISDPNANIEIGLHQASRRLKSTIPEEGVVVIKNLPTEVMLLRVYAGRPYSLSSTNPLQQPSFVEEGFYIFPKSDSAIQLIMEGPAQ